MMMDRKLYDEVNHFFFNMLWVMVFAHSDSNQTRTVIYRPKKESKLESSLNRIKRKIPNLWVYL